MKNILQKIRLASHAFIPNLCILTILYVLSRLFETGYSIIRNGYNSEIFVVFFYGILKDLAFISLLCIPLFVLYFLFFLISRKIANIFFIITSILLLVIQVALVQYFLTAFVPLGGDLWQYSTQEIKQTVGASGSVSIVSTLIFLSFIALTILSFITLSRRIKGNNAIAIVLFLVVMLGVLFNVNSQVTKLRPAKNEFLNALSINKTYFFYEGTLEHFFPQDNDLDIYSDSYSGDFEDGAASSESVVTFKYADEHNYPFLHSDETQDVLSSYFKFTTTKPNIVILLVEGLGRAFSCQGGYLGNFTPFVDSLSQHSLYWSNFLSEGGRTFAVLPSLLGSLPFGKNGFCEMGDNAPKCLSLPSLLKLNGYNTAFYYGGNAHFDLMDVFLKNNAVTDIKDINTFPSGYVKMPAQDGFSWGYGDKELFRRYFDLLNSNGQSPYLSILLTVSTHSPFIINEEDTYLKRVEQRMDELHFSDSKKSDARNYKYQFASILFTDDAIRNFFNEYAKRADFNNTIFFITGDHRMPEIPMIDKIDRYHVPLIIYSPLLTRHQQFNSISTHFDIAPSVLAMLKTQYHIKAPQLVSWLGSGLDTSKAFRNIHAYPIMQTKNDLVDFISGQYMINHADLFNINNNATLAQTSNKAVYDQLNAQFDKFKQKNATIINGGKIIPDSLYEHYYPH